MIRNTFLLALAMVFFACNKQEKRSIDYQKLKLAVEDSTSHFELDFISHSHMAMVFQINDYKVSDSIVSDSTFMKRRAGRFTKPKSGSFEVILLDTTLPKTRQEVYYYRMASPLYQRVEKGPRKAWWRMKYGTFTVPLPHTNFTHIELREDHIIFRAKLR